MLLRIYLGAIVLTLLLTAGGPALAHFRILPSNLGFMIYLLGGVICIVLFILAAPILMFKGAGLPFYAGLLCAVPGALLVTTGVSAMRHPVLNDVSTDLEQMPKFVHAWTLPENKGADLGYPEAFRALVKQYYAEVAPLTTDRSTEEAFAAIQRLAKANSIWDITHIDTETLTLEGIETSPIFRWQDDFLIRVTQKEDQTRVDMRSRSRTGKSDLGANARRIQRFLKELGLVLNEMKTEKGSAMTTEP